MRTGSEGYNQLEIRLAGRERVPAGKVRARNESTRREMARRERA